MSTIIEFLFCPQHGVFGPANLPLISAAYMTVRDNVSSLYATYRYKRMRDLGAF